MSSQNMHSQSYNMHALTHILGTCALISVVEHFSQFTLTPSRNCVPPLSHTPEGGRTDPQKTKNQENMAVLYSILYIYSRAIQFYNFIFYFYFD